MNIFIRFQKLLIWGLLQNSKLGLLLISLGSEFQNLVADTWKVPAPSDSLLYFGQIKFKDPYLLCLSVEHISILKPTVTMNYVVCCCQSWYGDSLSIMLWWQPTNLEKQKHLTQLITVALSWEVPVDDQQQWKPYFLVAIDLSRLLYLLKWMPWRWSSAPLYRGRCLFEGGIYLKIGPYKEIFSFNLTAYLQSVWKKLQLVTETSFHCDHSPLSALFSDVFTRLRCYSLLWQQPFFEERSFQCSFRLSL